MKRKIKKKFPKKRKIKRAAKSISLLPILFIILFLGLFSETVRTLPAGAFSEISNTMPYKLPKLNSGLVEKQIFNKDDFLRIKEEIIFEKIVKKEKKIERIEKDFQDLQVQINENSQKKIEKEIIIAKAPETNIEQIDTKIIEKEIVDVPKILDVPKIEETIKLAQDTSATTITVDGEEKLIPGSSEKNITYMQILQKPNDLDLNLKYAQQQGKAGNYKQTISTLERLNMLYPDNVEIKLYLLSVLVQADSPNKALTIIEQIKGSEDLTAEDLATVNEIEEEMKSRGKPKLWNYYADIGFGGVQSNNVNSVSKNRLQMSSDEVIGFATPRFDQTYSGSLGLTATRAVGEASSLMINISGSGSDQAVETTDNYSTYGMTVAFDTTLGNQSLSPYFMLSKSDYKTDADSISVMSGIGGYFSVGENHSFSYGYSFSDSKADNNSSDTTADATNAIGHGFTLGHDYMINEIISSSTGLGYSISEAQDATNDYVTYDLSFRLNFAFPWAYISVGDAFGFNDYDVIDTSTNSSRIRSDVTNTFDIMLTKAVGDLIPFIDPNKSLFFNIAYEKILSEANIMNYDYIADSVSLSFSKSIHLNK
tara:strand:+ start:202 stop:1986 length:1785 start_codon:yes stop_codon:yes gene_type:complete